MRQLTAAGIAVATQRETISAALYDAVGATGTEPRVRKALLRLRRNIHNSRLSELDESVGALRHPAIYTRAQIPEIESLLSEFITALAATKGLFIAALHETRAAFQAAVGDEDFRCGLSFASPSLFSNVGRFQSVEPCDFGGREEQIERGLLRYYTRMATKGTPFSRFCAVVPGSFMPVDPTSEPGTPSGAALLGAPKMRSVVRLNKSLFPPIWKALAERDGTRNRFHVEINPTLRVNGKQLNFLAAKDDLETFRRVELDDPIQVVLDTFRGQDSIAFGSVVEALSVDKRVDASIDESSAFAIGLVDIGFLRFRTGIHNQDADWDVRLVTMLDGLDDERARAICRLLKELRQLAMQITSAKANEREQLFLTMRSVVELGLKEIGSAPLADNIFICYEDATTDGSAVATMTPQLEEALRSLSFLLELMLPFAAPLTDQATMRFLFDQWYPSSQGPKPLLDFYEEFFRRYYKAHLAGVRRRGINRRDHFANEFNLEVIEARKSTSQRLQQFVAARCEEQPNAEEVVLAQADIEDIVRTAPAPQGSLPFSVDVFVNPIVPQHRGDSWRFVLSGGGGATGFGKYFSRFLHLFPPAVTERIFVNNCRSSSGRLAEISTDGNFNGNLHPTLLRWEIDYPTPLSEGALTGRMSCSDLVVDRDLDDPHSLRIVHAPTQSRVWPIDLGFQNPYMRPALFQLLRNFSPLSGMPVLLYPAAAPRGTDQPVRPAGEEAADAGPRAEAERVAGVHYRPRISFAGRIVLSRRRWLIPEALVPLRMTDESRADYFVRLNLWRATHGIPERVFVRILRQQREGPANNVARDAERLAAERAAQGVAPEVKVPGDGAIGVVTPEHAPEGASAHGKELPKRRAPQRVSRDYLKPQFIDFASPCLVGLFSHLGAGITNYTLSVEECLPDVSVNSLSTANDAGYATEWLLQVELE